MKRVKMRLACGFALAIMGAGAVSSGSAAPGGQIRTLSTAGDVIAIAADGTRVAAATRVVGACDRAVVWTAPGKTSQTFVSKTACAGTAFHDMPEIAIAGNRVEWLAVTGGNLQDMVLESAVLGKPKVSMVAFAENQGGAEGGVDGDWIGNLYGDDSLLVFDTWRECSTQRPEGALPCPAGTTSGDVIFSGAKLWKLAPKSLVRAGTNAYAAVAADAGRIAVQDTVGGSIALVTPAGMVSKTISIPVGDFSGVALQGRQLVALRNSALEVYDVLSSDAKPVATIPIPAGKLKPVLRDVQSGLAVYVRGTQVHVVRLSDGKEVRIGVPGTGHVDAQIEPAGLFYSYNVARPPAHGRIAFLPFAGLLKKFQ